MEIILIGVLIILIIAILIYKSLAHSKEKRIEKFDSQPNVAGIVFISVIMVGAVALMIWAYYYWQRKQEQEQAHEQFQSQAWAQAQATLDRQQAFGEVRPLLPTSSMARNYVRSPRSN